MRVLIIEDDATIAHYLRKSLEAEGFRADVAFDGEEGFNRAFEGSYDAITLDVMLPKKNGYEVCRDLRAAGITSPILMLTAKDGEYDEADAFDMGADDFLRKPFSFVVLLARLKALMRRGGTAKPSVLTVGDLELDTQSRRVARAGVDIELTPREFALLEHLVLNAGHVQPKRVLLERVWGRSALVDENVVEVYIGYVRKKVDAPFPEHLIRTVRGVGYTIDKGSGR